MPTIRCPTCGAELHPTLADLHQTDGARPALRWACEPHSHVVLRPLERLVALALGEAVGSFLRWGAA